MITRNFIEYQKWLSGDRYQHYVTLLNGTSESLNYMADTGRLGNIGALMANGVCDSVDHKNGGVYFGRGSTPATVDDYKLEQPIESGLTVTNPLGYCVFAPLPNGDYVYHASYTVTNAREEAVTIQELGLFSKASGLTHLALFDRIVLDEPILLQPNETTVITYRVVNRTYRLTTN